jgi:hypothetical protein
MSALTWSALGFFFVVLLGGSAAVGWMGWKFWQRLQAALATSSRAVGDLASTVEALEGRVSGLEGRTGELERASRQLSRSLRRAGVLLAAAQESRAAIEGWLRFVPRS